jgi:predicted ribosome quality control (RQC) complex YloA/Tae2 family protein
LKPEAATPEERQAALVRALKRYRSRLDRKLQAMRGDLAEAERGPEFRRFGEALLSYLRQVPARASSVTLPDPADSQETLEIALDPNLNAQGNAARYFKRASKGERGRSEIPPRIARTEKEVRVLTELLARADSADVPPGSEAPSADPALLRDLETAFSKIPLVLRESVGAAKLGPKRAPAKKGEARAPSSRLQPRRLKTSEGWDVLIGRSNEGNDYLTHKLARPEDYWFHVHGAAGSHVVLRRGKGKDEPSKQTLVEVAAWAAHYSQARTAGKVPVIYTRKKYVRKPRGSKPGLAVCEREKTVMVRPVEPEQSNLANSDADLSQN